MARALISPDVSNGVSDKRILLTGGAGFLGSKVRERLEAAGAAEVFVPRRADYDLTDAAAVARAYEDARPDTVVHLAAEVGGIGANRDNPGRYFFANMAMGLHLIEEARRRGTEKFVQVGTVCSYPKHTPVPFSEDELWNGYPEETNAPYGVAKKALLVMMQAYRAQYGLNGAYLMPVNLYGPGDNFDLESSHVIPALIRKCEEARAAGRDEVVCWGTGSASREFLYVDDCADAILAATERYDEPEPINIGAHSEITIRELTELIARLTGFEGKLVWDNSKPDGQPRRCLDTSRATKLLGFTASTSLEEGLRETIAWFRAQAMADVVR
ncbi:MAG TPA: GDP-L-fucose synthase [Thermoleophilaceae bacterium]|nr:GDP-L-fucose synthase [Thermoleophilaceae bacterium]